LAHYAQETRRQKAHQIGEIARVVERHATENPVSDACLESEFSQEDGTLGLSWSSLPREKAVKARKAKLDRAFEEQFFNSKCSPHLPYAFNISL
jgi:hypothetical protein